MFSLFPVPRLPVSRLPVLALLCASLGISWSNAAQGSVLEPVIANSMELCQQARQLAATDVEASQSRWQQHLQLLEQVKAADESLLRHPKPELAEQLEHCQQIGSSIQRLWAAERLQQGLTHCEASRDLMSQRELNGAQREYQIYQVLSSEALDMTHSILDIPTLARRYNQCKPLATELEQLEITLQTELNRWQQAATAFQSLTTGCEQLTMEIVVVPPTSHQLTLSMQAAQQLEQRRQVANELAHPWLQDQLPAPKGATPHLTELSQQAIACQGKLMSGLRQQQRSQQQWVKDLETSNDLLSAAVNTCEEGLVAAEWQRQKDKFDQSATLKRQALTPEIIASAEYNPGWQQSNRFVALLKLSKDCQQKLARLISAADDRVAIE